MAEKQDGVISIALRLFIICFVSTLVLAAVNMMTKDKIEENNKIKFEESCRAVMGDAEFETVDLSSYGDNVTGALARDEDGSVIGICIKQSVKGYNSGLVFMTGILSDGKTVTGINIMEHEETPGLGANADTDEFKSRLKNKKAPLELSSSAGENKDNTFDAITGATKTSNGIKNGVNRAAEIASDYFEKEGI